MTSNDHDCQRDNEGAPGAARNRRRRGSCKHPTIAENNHLAGILQPQIEIGDETSDNIFSGLKQLFEV